jgi:hypothetical protein
MCVHIMCVHGNHTRRENNIVISLPASIPTPNTRKAGLHDLIYLDKKYIFLLILKSLSDK